MAVQFMAPRGVSPKQEGVVFDRFHGQPRSREDAAECEFDAPAFIKPSIVERTHPSFSSFPHSVGTVYSANRPSSSSLLDMRSPVIAFSIFAAAAVSPTLVGAAPSSPNLGGVSSVPGPAGSATDTATHAVHAVRELSLTNDRHAHHKQERRVEDYRAAGGNSYSGSSGTVSGGDVINQAGSNDNTITNTDSSK